MLQRARQSPPQQSIAHLQREMQMQTLPRRPGISGRVAAVLAEEQAKMKALTETGSTGAGFGPAHDHHDRPIHVQVHHVDKNMKVQTFSNARIARVNWSEKI